LVADLFRLIIYIIMTITAAVTYTKM